ncbi:MAG: saccharopine dehydrogenase C-terminal domain-containing protein [Ilumatobacteraceae bacterium]
MPDVPLATIHGPLLVIGLGSIGRGLLPLLERHLDFDYAAAVVIDPDDTHRAIAEKFGFAFLHEGLTPDNYRQILSRIFAGSRSGLCINVSVDTSSVDIMRCVRENGALYIDTVTEPWEGFYLDHSVGPAGRTNEVLRAQVLAERRRSPGGPTAVSCCGANPGAVSWFVKEALARLAAETGPNEARVVGGDPIPAPEDAGAWARLLRDLGVRGIHIAERDTQRSTARKPTGEFWNTWSVDGFIAEGLQPAELGWGSHERWMPDHASRGRNDERTLAPGVFLATPGAATQVRTWCPTYGTQLGYLITHNEALSLADYFTVFDDEFFRPTVHYAYHPCDDALVSFDEVLGGTSIPSDRRRVLDAAEISEGFDELGVLLYGQPGGAYWFGSHLTIDEARSLAPLQNATGLQVTSAILAAAVWAVENPHAGIVEAEQMDHQRCLEIQRPYLGRLFGTRTDWTPITGRSASSKEDLDLTDPWQFRNVLVH